MSGDVQPRKRKEKRKKKEDVSEDFTNNFTSDETIHVQKDAGTGGNVCAKIVFFFLLGVLLVLVGLIITEYRGSTDLDNPILESRWAPIFDGWIDDSPAKHEDHGEHEGPVSEEDHGDEHDEHDDRDEHEEEHEEADEHEEDEEEEEEGEGDEEEGEEEGEEPSEEGGDMSGEESPEPQVDSAEESGEEQKDDDDDDDDDNVDDTSAAEDTNDDEDTQASEETVIPGVTESAEDGDNQDDEDEGGDEDEDEDEEDENASDGDLDDAHSGEIGPKSAEKNDDDDDNDDEEEEEKEDAPNVRKADALKESGENDENDSEDDEDAGDDGGDEEESDEEPESLGASSQAPPGNDESEEGEEEKPVRSPARGTPGKEQPQGGAKSLDEDDWVLQNDLNSAEADLDENPEAALKKFTTIVMKYPDSLPARYGKAKALDNIAELKHSNMILDQAIEEYQQILNLGQIVPDDLFLRVADRCINRMRFKGQHQKAVPVHKSLMARFRDVPIHSNQLAVTFLIINRINEAKQLLQETLRKWPNDGFAQVHYGFILKTAENDMAAAVQYLERGIRSRVPGTIDGRFFFQLGDALMRLGRKEEAMKVHELGVNEGLFLSKYQRSLYNIDRLHGQPWWNLEETTYVSHFKMLLSNWKTIQKEGLNALYNTSLKLYKDESENLKDFGQWKQLELFARGRRIVANCNIAPVTCSLIERFPAARSCKRGQVKFSVMHPGTHVWPHCGPTNCRLRAHLGLVVPQNTFIRVAEETRSWEEGKFIIFDDSFEHEVWHNGTTTRLVLIVDIWHPGLTEEEKSTLTAI